MSGTVSRCRWDGMHTVFNYKFLKPGICSSVVILQRFSFIIYLQSKLVISDQIQIEQDAGAGFIQLIEMSFCFFPAGKVALFENAEWHGFWEFRRRFIIFIHLQGDDLKPFFTGQSSLFSAQICLFRVQWTVVYG